MRRLSTLQGPVVLISSRLGLDPAAAPRSTGSRLHAYAAPLLPKVRGQFAEFLSEGSLVHLGLLDQPTWVGLRYGQEQVSLAAFRASGGSKVSAVRCRKACASPLGQRRRGFAAPVSLPACRALVSPHLLPCWFPHQSNDQSWYGNVYPLSIGFPTRVRLRPD
jgi:hypothetical protein